MPGAVGSGKNTGARANHRHFIHEDFTVSPAPGTGFSRLGHMVDKSPHVLNGLSSLPEKPGHALSDRRVIHRKIKKVEKENQKQYSWFSRSLRKAKSMFFHGHSISLNSVNAIHLAHITKYGKPSLHAQITEPLKALRGMDATIKGISIGKRTVSLVAGTMYDMAAHNRRREAQKLLSEYDPETRKMNTAMGNADLERLKMLAGNTGADLVRSPWQIVIDKVLAIKNLLISTAGLTESVLLFAGRFTTVVAPFIPGVSAAVTSVFFIKSVFGTGVQIAALNNLASAEEAANDPLLKALCGHIKQERTFHARCELASTAVNAFSAGANIAAAASGVGALPLVIASGSLGLGNAMITAAFNARHNRELDKQREFAKTLRPGSHEMISMATSNISVAEKAFLTRLRQGNGDELKACVDFLRKLGVSETTIAKLQLCPEQGAMQSLQQVLYSDRLSFTGLNLLQTGKTFLHVTGASAASHRVKSGFKWFQRRVLDRTHANEATKTLSATSTSMKTEPIRHQNNQPSLFTKYLQGRRHYLLLEEES